MNSGAFALTVQNKIGDVLLVVSSASFRCDHAVLLADNAFERVLSQFQTGQQVERHFQVDHGIISAVYITDQVKIVSDLIALSFIDKAEFMRKASYLLLNILKQLVFQLMMSRAECIRTATLYLKHIITGFQNLKLTDPLSIEKKYFDAHMFSSNWIDAQGIEQFKWSNSLNLKNPKNNSQENLPFLFKTKFIDRVLILQRFSQLKSEEELKTICELPHKYAKKIFVETKAQHFLMRQLPQITIPAIEKELLKDQYDFPLQMQTNQRMQKDILSRQNTTKNKDNNSNNNTFKQAMLRQRIRDIQFPRACVLKIKEKANNVLEVPLKVTQMKSVGKGLFWNKKITGIESLSSSSVQQIREKHGSDFSPALLHEAVLQSSSEKGKDAINNSSKKQQQPELPNTSKVNSNTKKENDKNIKENNNNKNNMDKDNLFGIKQTHPQLELL